MMKLTDDRRAPATNTSCCPTRATMAAVRARRIATLTSG